MIFEDSLPFAKTFFATSGWKRRRGRVGSGTASARR